MNRRENPISGDSHGARMDNAPAEPPRSRHSEQPLIPFNVLDAPSQRFYLSSLYMALTAWRLFDYFRLLSDQTDSLWLFMKWVAIDGVFLYSLPELKVPWLSWSLTATTAIFIAHAISNAVLMFRIPVSKPLLEMHERIFTLQANSDLRYRSKAGSLRWPRCCTTERWLFLSDVSNPRPFRAIHPLFSESRL